MNTIAQNSISSKSERRIFAGCLSAYNNGVIHGDWLDLSDYNDIDELKDKVNEILKSSPFPGDEYDIQDCEGFEYLLKEECYPSLSKAWAIHKTLLRVEREGIDTDLFLSFVDSTGYSNLVEEEDNCLLSKFQDSYRGCFDSLEDYGENFANDCGYLSEIENSILLDYIDFERLANDMVLNGDIFTIETGYRQVHVFSNYY